MPRIKITEEVVRICFEKTGETKNEKVNVKL
jgi:hypothetical protein